MQHLPAAFAAMAPYRQWMLFKLVPSRRNPGKMDKLPCHPITGDVVTAHDSANWTTAEHAVVAANALGGRFGVAFVLTQEDPFWFLDIDGAAMHDGSWSELAQAMLTYFAGCAVEVSSSGSGLHIIGSGAHLIPPHGKKNISSRLELYTTRRFIALTGNHAMGDSGFTPPLVNLQWLAGTYFPPSAAENSEGELSSEPVKEWRGPEDDEVLLRRALRSGAARSAFGGQASFADLWDANEEALARSYPPDPGGALPWDGSSADMALASHLAFWTGRHGERIRRLMERSALVRDKWDREDYIVGTIARACALTTKVLQDPPPAEAPIAGALPPVAAHPESLDPETVLMPQATLVQDSSAIVYPEDQPAYFAGCVYVRSAHRVYVPSGELLRPETFAVAYGGKAFPMDRENGKITFNAWEAFSQSRVVRHPQVAATCFRPLVPPGAIVDDNGRQSVNTYVPVKVPMVDGDSSIFTEHMAKLFPDERDRRIVLSYLAALVQHKGVKFKWCIVIQGVEGNGKSILSECAEFAVGRCYTHWPIAKEMDNRFNSWLYGNLLYCVEDIKVPRSNQDFIEVIKPMITGTRSSIENKGVDQLTKDVCGNFIFNTNHKNGIRKSRNDRRLAVFFNPQQEASDLERHGMGADYFARLQGWLRGEGAYAHLGANYGFAVVAHFLATYPIDPEFNPAGACSRAPKTSSTEAALLAGLGAAEQYILEAVEEGRVGFRGGWVSSHYLTRMLDEQSMKYYPAGRAQLMRSIGYHAHPALNKGRVNNVVQPDGTRSVLYVHVEDAELNALTNPAEIASRYTQAQNN